MDNMVCFVAAGITMFLQASGSQKEWSLMLLHGVVGKTVPPVMRGDAWHNW